MKQYVQFTAGRGPAECARAVAKIAREFCRECAAQDIDVDIVDSEPHHDAPDSYRACPIIYVDAEAVSH